MSWTQSICLGCWWVRNPDRQPAVLTEPERETCCDCGRDTIAGIYVRLDPNTVRFPAEEGGGDS